jgi:hypothetical protein
VLVLDNGNSLDNKSSVPSTTDFPDFWFNEVGGNVFPRDGKIPIIKTKPWRNKRLPAELYNHWKQDGELDKNFCVMVGAISGPTDTLNFARSGLHLNFADFDNLLAIRELCTWKGNKHCTLQEFAKIGYVVQHSDDRTHCHIYWLASKPMPRRRLETDKKTLELIKSNQLPAIEIKGQGDVAFCSGGYHESGNQYLPLIQHELFIIEELGEHIQNICRKYLYQIQKGIK